MTAVWHQYAKDVVAGKVVAGELVTLACERHLRDLVDGPDRGLNFDDAAAAKVIKFFSFLRHSKGRWGRGGGQCFELAPWQQFCLASIFGWKRSDELRRFRIAYLEVPRKNGKSTLSAGVGLYLLLADGEPGAEIYAAATTKDQARICWTEAKRMALKSPPIRKRVEFTRDCLSTDDSFFKPLPNEPDSLDGLNPHGAIIDELHAHPTRELWDVIDTATGARDQPLIFAITTAGNNVQSVCWEQHEYGRKVLEGTIDDDSNFAFIACPDKDDDVHRPRTWQKANPSYGVTVTEDYMRDKARKAKNNPASMNGFRQKHLDVWVSKVIDQVIGRDQWAALQQEIDLELLRELPCWMAIDLASTGDLTASAKVWRDEDNDRFILKSRIWIPEEVIHERSERDKVPYDQWVHEGWMEVTPGATTNYETIRDALIEDAQTYDVKEIAADRLFQGAWLVQQLDDEGIDVFAHGQGFMSMAIPTKQFLEAVFGRTLVADRNPVLAWMADNLALEVDSAGNNKPSKRKSAEKIDGIVAAIMALGRAHVDDSGSAYEDRGVLTL